MQAMKTSIWMDRVGHGFFNAMLLAAPLALAQGIEGKWRTIDDESGKPKAVVQISQSGNTFNGRIVSLAEGVKNECPACQPAVAGQHGAGL